MIKDYRIVERKTYDGRTATAYVKKIGNTTYHMSSLEDLEKALESHKHHDNSGAADWYGQGRYMGD